jgi:hypothetical protein
VAGRVVAVIFPAHGLEEVDWLDFLPDENDDV